jgi:hypothetical protein
VRNRGREPSTCSSLAREASTSSLMFSSSFGSLPAELKRASVTVLSPQRHDAVTSKRRVEPDRLLRAGRQDGHRPGVLRPVPVPIGLHDPAWPPLRRAEPARPVIRSRGGNASAPVGHQRPPVVQRGFHDSDRLDGRGPGGPGGLSQGGCLSNRPCSHLPARKTGP